MTAVQLHAPSGTDGLGPGPPRPLRVDRIEPSIRAKADIDVVETLEGAQQLAAEWTELATAAGADPMHGPLMRLVWWEHIGTAIRGARLHVVTARVGGRLVALAPWHTRWYGGLTLVRWLGHGLGAVGELLVRPGFDGAADAVWRHVASVPRVLVDLLEYRDDGGGLSQLRRGEDLRSVAALRDVCPVIDLTGIGSADELVGRLHRRSALRRGLRNADRKAARAGAVWDVETAREPGHVMALLPLVGRLWDASAAANARLHLLRGRWQPYTVDLLGRLAAQQACTLLLARIDGRPAAFQITIEDDATMTGWVARYDPAFAAAAPGHRLIRSLVDHAIARGMRCIDQGIGDGPHKVSWATNSYDTLTVRAAPRALAARVATLNALYGAVTVVKSGTRTLAAGRPGRCA